MSAVIFRATLANPDDEYYSTAAKLRKIAMDQYNCIDFVSIQQGDLEIAISYWHSQRDIDRWKQDPGHVAAQQRDKKAWYRNWQVEVTEVRRSFTGE